MKPTNDRTIVSLDASPFFLLDGQRQSKCRVDSATAIEYEQVVCPVDLEGHRRPGRRLNRLNVVVPCNPEPDVIFTEFHEYLMTGRTHDQFIAHGITGIDFVPTKAVSKRTRKSPERDPLGIYSSYRCSSCDSPLSKRKETPLYFMG